MKLFLASQARDPESLTKLKDFVGGLEGKTIAYIPTAANGEEPYGAWKTDSETWEIINTLGAKVTPFVLEDYKNSSVLPELKGKDILWFAGGMCGYLMYWIRRCEIDKHIRELLDARSVYVGSSAGSMITSKTLDLAEWDLLDAEVGASVIPGLGLVDFQIYPHFEDELRSEIEKRWQKGTLYLLKNGEVITVVEGKIEVLGEERIIKK